MSLELLELRLRNLENTVIGSKELTSTPSTTILDQLSATHRALSIAENRPNILRVLARVTEVQKYTDANFIENDITITKAKMEILLLEANNIKKIAADLKTVQEMSDVLNHPSFSQLSVLRKRLQNLRNNFVCQKRRSDALLQESQEFLNKYCILITELSKLFVQWNQQAIESNSNLS